MTFNISDFKAVVDHNGGLQKASNFEVHTFGPSRLQNSNVQYDLRFLADSASIPGIGFTVNDIKHLGFGLSASNPHATNFEDMTITFLSDGNNNVRRYFEEWMAIIYNHGRYSFENPGGVPLFQYGYPDEYEGNLVIRSFDNTGNEVKAYTLQRVYPKAIGSSQVGWEMNDVIIRVPVTFQFYSWKSDDLGYLYTTTNSRIARPL